MKWFVAKIVWQICIENGKGNVEFDEQWRLINATSPQDAFVRARNIGKKREEKFLNSRGELVTWKFIDVEEINFINDWSDGVEIKSNTLQAERANDYISFVKSKAMLMQNENALVS